MSHQERQNVTDKLAQAIVEGGSDKSVPRTCAECGCTDRNACWNGDGPCWWVGPFLCSECA